MTNQSDHADSVKPFLYALFGTVFLAIGGMLFVNLNEDPETFMVFTVLFTAPGLYLLIWGRRPRDLRGSSLIRGPRGKSWSEAFLDSLPHAIAAKSDIAELPMCGAEMAVRSCSCIRRPVPVSGC